MNAHSLHHGRSRSPLATIEPDADFPNMYRVHWPDGVVSPMANLARCKDAALAWAERTIIREDIRKNGAGRALKSLPNFSWSSRLVRLSGGGGQ